MSRDPFEIFHELVFNAGGTVTINITNSIIELRWTENDEPDPLKRCFACKEIRRAAIDVHPNEISKASMDFYHFVFGVLERRDQQSDLQKCVDCGGLFPPEAFGKSPRCPGCDRLY